MASKKKSQAEQRRIQERKAFVAARPNLSKEEARKRFYVTTRAQELQAAGKDVNRQALRRKFETGQVQRAGFLTPQDVQRAASRRSVSTSSSSSTLPSPSTTGRVTPVTNRSVVSPMQIDRSRAANVKTTPAPPKQGRQTAGSVNFLNKAIDVGLGAVRGAGKLVVDTAEQAQAAFVAPVWNPTVGRISPKLKVRQAGTKEGLITAAVTIASLPTGGAGGAAIRSVGGKVASKVIPKIPGSRAVTSAGRAIANEARLILPGKGGVKVPPTPVRTAPRPTAPGGTRSVPRPGSAPAPKPVKAVAKKAAERPVLKTRKPGDVTEDIQSIFSGITDAIVGAGKDIAKGTTGAAARKATAAPVKAVAKKAAPVKAAGKKVVAKKAAPVKATAKKSVAKKKMTKQEKIDYAKSPQMGKDLEKMTKGRVKRVPKEAAPVKQPATKKLSAQKTSTGPSSTQAGAAKPVTRLEGTPAFRTQADYNKFMDTGGRYRLSQMTNESRESFLAANRRWAVGRGQARTQAARARTKAEGRRILAARRLGNIRSMPGYKPNQSLKPDRIR